jgi:hypothetical protein
MLLSGKEQQVYATVPPMRDVARAREQLEAVFERDDLARENWEFMSRRVPRWPEFYRCILTKPEEWTAWYLRTRVVHSIPEPDLVRASTAHMNLVAHIRDFVIEIAAGFADDLLVPHSTFSGWLRAWARDTRDPSIDEVKLPNFLLAHLGSVALRTRLPAGELPCETPVKYLGLPFASVHPTSRHPSMLIGGTPRLSADSCLSDGSAPWETVLKHLQFSWQYGEMTREPG